MPTLNAFGNSYTCARAQRGVDFVRLLDDTGYVIFFAGGVSDFSVFELVDGTWEVPMAITAPTTGANASMSGSIIQLSIPSFVSVETGLHVDFFAPCNCDAVTQVSVNGNICDIVDAMGNSISSLGSNVFCAGALVSIVLDIDGHKAYLQNAASSTSYSDPLVASGELKIEPQKYTVTVNLEDGSSDIAVLETDENDYPQKLTYNGREIPWTVTEV